MSDNYEYEISTLNAALKVSNRTIKSLEEKLGSLQKLIERMEHDKKNMVQIKIASEEIIKRQLAFSDGEKAKLQNEIMELKSQIKELKAARQE